MIYQNDTDLLPTIRLKGCYLLCIVYLTRKLNRERRKFSALDINTIYNEAYRKELCSDTCYIKHPTKISYLIAEMYKWNFYGAYQGFHSQRYSVFSKNEIILGCYKHIKTHFVILDGWGLKKKNIIYDPLFRSNTVKYGFLHSTRIYTKEKM